MIEVVVALLMFWDGEIKEHRIQESMAACLRARRIAEREKVYDRKKFQNNSRDS
jgi:hypothetical protein